MSTISPRHWVRVSVLIAATLILLPSKLSFAIVGSGGISSSNGTLSVDSSQTGFLANSSSVTCSSSTGKLIVETDGNTLGWCNGSTAYRTALGDTSGKALSGDSATNFFASGILESTIGGTGNGFTKFSGPTTSERIFTLPDASTTICTTNSTCSGYQAALTGGDVTTTSGGASATIGNDKITEPMLKSVNAPTDEQCLTYEATVGDFEWQACASGGSGITGITADSGGATTGTSVTLAGGAGITTTRASDTVTVAVSTVPATNGGTGVTSYVANTMYYAPAATPSALTPVVTPTPNATPMYLTYNGASTAPSWTKIDLASGVTGTLPAGSGGTGITSLGSGVATFLGTPSSANLLSAVSDETGTGALVFANAPTIDSVELGHATDTTIARASAGIVTVEGNPVLETGYTSTATAAGTTVLTSASNYYQYFTGSSNQTVTLPVASTMVLGQGFEIHNDSTGTITVNSSGGNLVASIPASHTNRVVCILTSGTTAASWNATSLSINQRVIFTGPSSGNTRTYTLPDASTTLCGTNSVCTGYQSDSGTVAFNRLASGTNTTAAMVVGAGGALSASSTGTIAATSLAPATSTDGSRLILFPDNVSATPTPPGTTNQTNIYTRSGVGYVQPNHAASGWGYQIQASQVELGSNTTQAITFSTSVALTLASLNSIQFTLKANKKYWLQGSLYAIASAATADPTYAITISAGTKTIAVRVTCAMVDGTAAYTSMSIVADNTGTTCAIAGTGTTGGVTAMFDGYVSTTSDATLDIKASPAGTGTLTIQAYPLFRLTEFLDP